MQGTIVCEVTDTDEGREALATAPPPDTDQRGKESAAVPRQAEESVKKFELVDGGSR